MDVQELELDDMDSSESSRSSKEKEKILSVKDENFINERKSGTYEIIDNNKYEVLRDISEEKCVDGSERTHMVAHFKSDELGISYWLSLCQKHYSKIKHDNELDILSDSRRPY